MSTNQSEQLTGIRRRNGNFLKLRPGDFEISKEEEEKIRESMLYAIKTGDGFIHLDLLGRKSLKLNSESARNLSEFLIRAIDGNEEPSFLAVNKA